jgi:site-specific DNA recombinase
MKAVIYIRVSTTEQASSNQSLPVQESKARGLCQQRGLHVLRLFADKGESARTDDRPQFKKMMEYCRQHRREISHVVVSDLSRLARNVLDQGQTIVALTEMGIALVSVDEPNLDDSAAGRLLKNVLGSMNQFFSDSLSEKTKDRMAAGVKQGRWLWVAPLGYQNDTRTKQIVTDSERSPLVRKAFELLAEGKSIGDVMRQVTALGLATRKGRHIPKQTFSRLIRNPFYCGWIENNGTRVRGTHDPLISEEIFNTVQQRLSGKAPTQIVRDDFPLRGFVQCWKCGNNLTAGMVKGRSKSYPRYWCWTPRCRSTSVTAEELEKQTYHLFHILQPGARTLAMLPTLAARTWDVRKERIAADAKSLVRRLDEQNTLNQRAIKARLMGELSEEDFKSFKASTEAETERLQEQIRALDSERSTMEELVKQADREIIDLGESWRSAPPRRKREIQTALFPEGLAYDPESGYFTPRNHSFCQSFITMLEQASLVGVPDGI